MFHHSSLCLINENCTMYLEKMFYYIYFFSQDPLFPDPNIHLKDCENVTEPPVTVSTKQIERTWQRMIGVLIFH